MRPKYLIYSIICAACLACGEPNMEKSFDIKETSVRTNLDFQGHRGCRGLMPENTLPAFAKALDLGVTTLEMDVVITGDGMVILSHEPWFSHEIALDPEGKTIPEGEERNHRIFEMSLEETRQYDVGLKDHPRFPDQEKMSVQKPLLSELFAMAEAYSQIIGRDQPFYNIETKCLPERDGIFHPGPEKFVDLLTVEIKKADVSERTTIQSFDVRTLQVAKRKYPDIKLALLIENTETPDQNLRTLGFTPDIYSPDYALVDDGLISFAKERGMKVIPWTVNEPKDMERLIEMGVDGLITDYPNRLPSQD